VELGLIANKVEVKVEVAMQQGGSKGGTRWNSELGNPRKLHNPMFCLSSARASEHIRLGVDYGSVKKGVTRCESTSSSS